MQRRIRLLDVVALTADVPQHGLLRGHVGTVIQCYEQDQSVEIEFCDDDGRTYAQAALPASQLMGLHFRPVQVL